MRIAFLLLIVLPLIMLCSCENNRVKGNRALEEEPIECMKNSINGLQKNDTLSIQVKSDGCEHHTLELLRIYRNEDGLYSNFQLVLPYKKTTSKSISARLRDKNVKAFYDFEQAAVNRKGAGMGCTNQDKYMIVSNRDTLIFEDNSCSFHEYDKLKKSIFGERKLESYWNQVEASE